MPSLHLVQVLEAILDDDQDMQDMYLARRAEMAQMIAPNLDATQPPPDAPLAFLPSVSASGRAETALSEALHSVAESRHGQHGALDQTGTSQQGALRQSTQVDTGQTGEAQYTNPGHNDTGQSDSNQTDAAQQGYGGRHARRQHGRQAYHGQTNTAQGDNQLSLQQAVSRMSQQWAEVQQQGETQQQAAAFQEEEAEGAEDRLTEHPLSMAVPDQVSLIVNCCSEKEQKNKCENNCARWGGKRGGEGGGGGQG